jgi:hypothetical protein
MVEAVVKSCYGKQHSSGPSCMGHKEGLKGWKVQKDGKD